MTQEEFEQYERLTADEQLDRIQQMGRDDGNLFSCELTLHRIKAAQRRHGRLHAMDDAEIFDNYMTDMKLVLPFALDYAAQIVEDVKKRNESARREMQATA